MATPHKNDWKGELLTSRLLDCMARGLDCSTCKAKCPLADQPKTEERNKNDVTDGV